MTSRLLIYLYAATAGFKLCCSTLIPNGEAKSFLDFSEFETLPSHLAFKVLRVSDP